MRTGLLLGSGGASARLWAGCWCLSLALLSFSALVTAQFTDEDGFDIDFAPTSEKTMQGNLVEAESEGEGSNSSSENNNNSTMRCWSCVARYRSWADCQNLDEMQYCEDPDVTTCMKSSIRIEGLLGRETRYHRLAGCGQNETALRDAYFEFFEITFGDSERVTLEEFSTCDGPLCNVMDEEALQRGKWRVVNGNVVTAGAAAAAGRWAGSAVASALMILAVRSFV
ncbi:uncharacterized protein LOC109415967 [Aedes albopictus]|uniref:Secreted protein n=1 Tax=Aedes albopictus TaxID=7160 RepID=A0ABM1YV50_AEDAL|nr:uncharacterized protein LOC115263870 [Aedes albopictus]